MTTVSADPVRAAVHILRAEGIAVYSDELPEGSGSPRAVVRFSGGDPDGDYIPYSVYSVDVLTFAHRPSEARRLAVKVHDIFKQVRRQRIEKAGLVSSMSLSYGPLQVWDDSLSENYYAQSWDIEIGYITNVD